jgi:CubicO group peptidase (beta-lactamase class C family)
MLRKLRTVAVATSLLLVASAARSQDVPKLPDTKPGQLVAEWLKQCDVADVAQLKKWGDEHLSDRMVQLVGADALAREQARDCAASGGYDLVSVIESKPDRVDIVARARRTRIYMQVRLSATPQGKTQGVGMMPLPPPESALPADLSDRSIATVVGSLVDTLATSDQFSGIVIIARGTQPIVSKAAGYANKARKTPITPQTRFTIGSMGKMFTATAVGQLVDQGRMSFDDVVGKFFPQFGNKTVRDKVTVAMLLSHTSGMGDFLAKRTPAMMKSGVRRAAEFMPLYEHDEPRFEPGTSWAYSNAGLALAGAIAEKVSGEDYPSYIRKHVFAAAGMANSDPNNVPHLDPRLVTPYTEARKPNARWQEAEHDIGSPAGGAISTAEDLVKFADALRGGKLVSQETLAKMTEGRPTPMGRQYGYATEVDNVYGRKVVGHSGGFPGVSTNLYVVLGSPYTAIVLANQDPPASGLVGETAKGLAAARAKKGS